MNKSLLTLSLIPIASVMHTYGTSHVPDNRPNIILFLVDDMGWQDTSLPFWTQRTLYNERYETPNMEKLAQQGMMFTQAYASSISSPTRCSLMTGCNESRIGLYGKTRKPMPSAILWKFPIGTTTA